MPVLASHGGHAKHFWCPILVVLAFFTLLSPTPTRVAAVAPAGITVDPAPVETFTGPDFVDFWWDPAAIPGCDSISIWRKTSSTSYTEVATPACAAGLVTDAALSPGTAYSYQFIVKNDAEPPVNIYLSFINATPGVIGGKLHRNLSLGGSLVMGGISVGANSQLTLNGAHVSGTAGAIADWIANWDGSVREQGAVLISSGTYSGTTFSLKNAGSTMQGGNWTNVQISTRANIQDATFIGSSIGFSGNGSIAFTSNVLTGTLVSVAESIVAAIESNAWTSSSLSFTGTASGSIDANSFSGSAVLITQQAQVTVSGNAFIGDRPDNSGFIIVTTDAGVRIDGNNLHFRNTSETHHAILIQPDTTPANQNTAYTLSNNILTGQNAGIGIQVHTDCNADVPDISIVDNTVARFTRAVSFDNRICPGGLITATVTGNTLTGNSYGILAALEGAGNALAVHNNCIAANTTGGISCGSKDTYLDAANNYWGHWTGPAHLTNPDGLGDRILCSDAASEIGFVPWLEDHACYISDLKIAQMEVVQTVQTISNTVALVAGKNTVVRVYPELGVGFSPVVGTLTGTRGGLPLGTLTASSPVYASSITDWDAARADDTSSLNFTLPPDWTEGVVELRAEVSNSAGSLLRQQSTAVPCVLGADTAIMTQTVSFNARKPVKIAYIPATINTLPDYFPVTTGDILVVHAKILAQFPFGNVDFRILPALDRYANIDNYGTVSGLYFAYISGVARRWDLINNPEDVADYYVTVYGTEKSTYTGSWFYFGEPGSKASCGLRNEGQDCLMSMGNQLGLRPLIFSKESAMPPYDYTFPYTDHRTHIFGYDTNSPQGDAIKTPDFFDLMSPEAQNGMPGWISDFHYEKIYLDLAPAPGAPGSAAELRAVDSVPVGAASANVADYLYVNGLAGPGDGRFYPVVHLQNSPEPDGVTPLNPAGAYCLRSRDGYGLVEEKCFDLNLTNPGTGAEDAMAAFSTFLTPTPGLRFLQLYYNGSLIENMVIPTEPPDITLLSAHYDSTYQTAQLAWTAPLAAAPNLHYHFHSSADNGSTWTPIGIDIRPENIQIFDGAFHWGVRAAGITPGAQTRFRLIASDGFNETTVTSSPFAVPDVGPIIAITSPANNAVIETFPIVLEGYAYDTESGDRSAAMTWRSSRDGVLGVGDKLSVSALSGGSHTLTLTAGDGDGHEGSDAIHLTVDVPVTFTESIFLPVVLRRDS